MQHKVEILHAALILNAALFPIVLSLCQQPLKSKKLESTEA
jgi:hypothetical protein